MTVPGDSTGEEITAYRDLLAQFERNSLELHMSDAHRAEGLGEHLHELRESIAAVTSELTARFKQEQVSSRYPERLPTGSI